MENLSPIVQSHPLVAVQKASNEGISIMKNPAVINVAKQPAATAEVLTGNAAVEGKAIVEQLTEINKTLKGVNEINRGALNDYAPKPLQITFTVNNHAGNGANPITAFAFNEDYLQATPTDNGSGAGSVEKSYSDGFSGNLLNHIMETYGIQGLPIKQIQITVTDNTTGLQDKAALNAVNPRKVTYNGDLTSSNQFIPLSSTGTPAYQQQGFLIIDIETRVRRFDQFLFNVNVNKTMTVIFVTL